MASSTHPEAAPEAVDMLDEDIITVAGQAFALVSFVSPHSNQRSDKCAMKIRGVFGTREEAASHVKKLMRIDNSFDIFLVDMYKWVPVPPDPNAVEDQEYTDQFLNELMTGYKESQLAAKQHFAERKRAVIEQGLEAAQAAQAAQVAGDLMEGQEPHPAASAPSGSGAPPSAA